MNGVCALALIFLMDVSGSVSAENYTLQRDGVAKAFQSTEVKRAILDQPGGIVVSVIQWSNFQKISVPWMRIQNEADISKVADAIYNTERAFEGSTLLAGSLQYGLAYMDQLPCEAIRKVIDVSGDGMNDSGPEHMNTARLDAEEQNVTVNGLAVQGAEYYIYEYYRNNVRTFNGFVILAETPEQFPRVIRKKMVMEIGQLQIEEDTVIQ